MSPLSRNAIEYGVDTLSTHRILHHKYDEEGKELDTLGAIDSGKRAELFDQVLKDYYETKGAGGDERNPTPVSVGAMERLAALEDDSIKEKAINEVAQLASINNLSLDDTLGRLVFDRFREAIAKALPSIGPEAEKLLIIRMFQEIYNSPGHAWEADEIIKEFGDVNMTEGKVPMAAILGASADREPEIAARIKEIAASSKRFHNRIIAPLVNIIFTFSAHALGTLKDLYVLNRDAEIERTRSTVLKTIKNLETLLNPVNSTDPRAEEKWEKFLAQRDKFKALEDKISEAEGFVFQWPPGSDNTYKFTGLFAPINQLLGMDPSRWAEGLVYTETPLTETWAPLAKRWREDYGKGPDPAREISEYAPDGRREEESNETILYLPGGFKPPHKGHFALAQDALDRNPGAKLVIMSGESPRDGITLDQARDVWKIYFSKTGKEGDIEVRPLKPEYPRDAEGNRIQKFVYGAGKKYNEKWDDAPEAARGVRTQDKVIDPETGEPMMVDYQTQSPINSIGNAVRFTDKPARAKIVASEADPENAGDIAKYLQGLGLDVEPEVVPVRVKDKSGVGKMSATNMRQAISKGFEAFVPFLPEKLTDQQADEVFTMLGGTHEELEEGSAMAVGSVGVPGTSRRAAGGYKLPDGPPQIKYRHEDSKNEQLVNEVVDYLLGITVG